MTVRKANSVGEDSRNGIVLASDKGKGSIATVCAEVKVYGAEEVKTLSITH